MPAFDWPLTIFTLITQVVLGAFAVLWVTDLLARQLADPGEQEYLTRIAVWLLGPLMAIGFAVSTLHLGQPMYAFRALSNVRTSWLSREILFLGAFFALGAGYAALWWRRRDAFTVRAVYGAVVGVVGALGLASMTALYLLPAMPSWYRISTPLFFVGSALILGPLLVASVFLATYRHHPAAPRLEPLLRLHVRAMAFTVLAGAGLTFTGLAVNVLTLPDQGLEGAASLALLTGEHGGLLLIRIALALAGVLTALLLLGHRLPAASKVRSAGPLVWGMFGVFAVSEVLGRVLFYATAVPIRPPMAFG